MIALQCLLYLCDMVVVKVLLCIPPAYHHYGGAQLHHGVFCDNTYHS